MSDGVAERVHRTAVEWFNMLAQRAENATASLPEDLRAEYVLETRALVEQAKTEMAEIMGADVL